MKIVVYSAVAGGYDVVLPPKFRDEGVEYVLLTDRQPLLRGGWTVRPLPPETAGMSPSEANRWCKFFAHRLFPDADMSVYLDGNVRQMASFLPYLEKMQEAGTAIGLFAHPTRAAIGEEFERCVRVGKIQEFEQDRYATRIAFYRAEGADEIRLTENSVVLRDHRSPRLDAVMGTWWAEYIGGIKRDQISLPWVLASGRATWRLWDRNFRETEPPLVYVVKHRRSTGLLSDAYFLAFQFRNESMMARFSYFLMEWIRSFRHSISLYGEHPEGTQDAKSGS